MENVDQKAERSGAALLDVCIRPPFAHSYCVTWISKQRLGDKIFGQTAESQTNDAPVIAPDASITPVTQGRRSRHPDGQVSNSRCGSQSVRAVNDLVPYDRTHSTVRRLLLLTSPKLVHRVPRLQKSVSAGLCTPILDLWMAIRQVISKGRRAWLVFVGFKLQ